MSGTHQRPWRSFTAAAAAAGVSALAVSPGQPLLAWVALVPLFATLRAASGRVTMGMGIVYAVVLGLASLLPWMIPATAAYVRVSPWVAAGFILPALPLLLAAHGAGLGFVLRLGPSGPGPGSVVWLASLWVCWEATRTLLFPYYPAAVLGTSQAEAPLVLQVASVGGVAAVTFVLVSCNAGLAELLRPADRRSLGGAAVAALVVLAALGFGALRLRAAPRPLLDAMSVLGIDVAAVTPADSPVERYLATSRNGSSPALIVWPESALSGDLTVDTSLRQRLAAFVEAEGVALLTGGPGSAPIGRRLAQYNAMHLLQPGRAVESYHKRQLVMFAERWPPLLGEPPLGLTSVEPGRVLPVLRVGERAFGVLVCFEIMDAAGARALAQRGAEFIVNATNDVYFGTRTWSPHLAWAPLRAVESGLAVVRVANHGVNAVFDPFGRRVTAAAGGELATGVPQPLATAYARRGEAFTAACALIVLAGIIAAHRQRRGTKERRRGDGGRRRSAS